MNKPGWKTLSTACELQLDTRLRILPLMDLSQLSHEQLKTLVRGIVDDRLRELLGDPDLGLQLGDGLRARLKESLSSRERLSGEDIANQLGLRW